MNNDLLEIADRLDDIALGETYDEAIIRLVRKLPGLVDVSVALQQTGDGVNVDSHRLQEIAIQVRNLDPRLVVVFWRYDRFPFALGGVGTIDPLGRAVIPSYGPGNDTFKREAILSVHPLIRGFAMWESLCDLENSYAQAEKDLRTDYIAKSAVILPELKVKR